MTNCSDSDAVVCWGFWSLEAKVTLALPPPWAVFISKQNYQKSQQDTVLELRINHRVYIFFLYFHMNRHNASLSMNRIVTYNEFILKPF